MVVLQSIIQSGSCIRDKTGFLVKLFGPGYSLLGATYQFLMYQALGNMEKVIQYKKMKEEWVQLRKNKKDDKKDDRDGQELNNWIFGKEIADF